MENTERTFFSGDGVLVTNARFVVGKQTYVMRNVTSVKSSTTPSKHNGSAFSMLVAVVLAIFLDGTEKAWAAAPVLIGLLCVSKERPTYHVMLTMTSNEIEAFSSRDSAIVKNVEDALNQAIIHGG